jgi:hypothetical protein
MCLRGVSITTQARRYMRFRRCESKSRKKNQSGLVFFLDKKKTNLEWLFNLELCCVARKMRPNPEVDLSFFACLEEKNQSGMVFFCFTAY